MSRHPNRKSISFLWANESFSPHFPISNNSYTEVTSQYLQNLLDDSFVIDGIFLWRDVWVYPYVRIGELKPIICQHQGKKMHLAYFQVGYLFAEHRNTEK